MVRRAVPAGAGIPTATIVRMSPVAVLADSVSARTGIADPLRADVPLAYRPAERMATGTTSSTSISLSRRLMPQTSWMCVCGLNPSVLFRIRIIVRARQCPGSESAAWLGTSKLG